MENIVSEASDFNKIQKNKSDLKINDLPKNKSQEKLQKCNTFRKVCQKNSPKKSSRKEILTLYILKKVYFII